MDGSRHLSAYRGDMRLVGEEQHWPDDGELASVLSRPARWGWLITAVLVLGFGGWAATVRLSGGAVAPGIISPEGSRRTVQHLEGGIIARLMVRDGDEVTKGQPLVEMQSLEARATHDSLVKQHRMLRLMVLRLTGERTGFTTLPLPSDMPADDPAVIEALSGQQGLMDARWRAYHKRHDIVADRIDQLKEQIRGYEAQEASTERQLALIADELQSKRALFKKGLTTKPALRQLERAEAEIEGRRGEYRASIAHAREQIAEAQMQAELLEAERIDQIASDLEKAKLDLMTTEERLRTSADVLARTLISAPVSGRIVELRYKTEGGVVAPGAPIMDIVPEEEVLLIDARIAPADIDVIHAGLAAQVQLTAYSSRTTPRVTGTVRSISADRLVDERTGQAYFLARIEVDRADLARIGETGHQVELKPGMAAEVLIVTGERTLVQYVFEPFMDALWRSFREV
ncbi:MAG: HlyD family type I secretion periplasmic adaptor subunit [Hyphomicrobiaceae bacterium]